MFLRRSQGCVCEAPLGGCEVCSARACFVCVPDRFLVAGRCRKELTCIGKHVRDQIRMLQTMATYLLFQFQLET